MKNATVDIGTLGYYAFNRQLVTVTCVLSVQFRTDVMLMTLFPVQKTTGRKKSAKKRFCSNLCCKQFFSPENLFMVECEESDRKNTENHKWDDK